jgi:AbrB family looped-hinge helix DNA binding protein
MITTVTSKGQVTLPAEARRRLGIKAGAKLEIVVTDNDRLEVIPVIESVSALKGMVPKPRRRLSLADLDAAIREAST